MDDRIKKVSQKLRELRKQKGFSSAASFAWQNDLSRVHYGRMERGHNFTLDSLLKVLDAHGITFEEFCKFLFEDNEEK